MVGCFIKQIRTCDNKDIKTVGPRLFVWLSCWLEPKSVREETIYVAAVHIPQLCWSSYKENRCKQQTVKILASMIPHAATSAARFTSLKPPERITPL
ncbi:hypothetical protein CEP53_002887 [Fusarium sp. AF-6]|nr:hypothetical protein CEP53_002887 [Fusarium sp. AF-6]